MLAQHPVPPHSAFLFLNRDGNTYASFAADFGNVIRRVVAGEAKAGREFHRVRVHDLRHRFAVRWLKSGGDIYRLSRHLGHTSVKTTEGYLRYLTDLEVDAVMGVAHRSMVAQMTAQASETAQQKTVNSG